MLAIDTRFLMRANTFFLTLGRVCASHIEASIQRYIATILSGAIVCMIDANFFPVCLNYRATHTPSHDDMAGVA